MWEQGKEASSPRPVAEKGYAQTLPVRQGSAPGELLEGGSWRRRLIPNTRCSSP